MAVVGLVSILYLLFPSPKPSKAELISNIPGDVVQPEHHHKFAPRKKDVLGVAREFVSTAVARHHTGRSWNLVTKAMRAGYTKKAWSSGNNIPVVPFPVDAAKYIVQYSDVAEVDVRVALFAPPTSRVQSVVFDLIVNRAHRASPHRWLVSSFTPSPSGSGDFGASRGIRNAHKYRNATLNDAPGRFAAGSSGIAHNTSVWLLLPLAIFGLLIVALGGVLFSSWRGNRLYRAHVLERQSSSARPS